MSRKRIYNTNTFSGGMTDDIRNTNDLSKCARVSHLDIYRDPNQMYVMPGYVSDNGLGGSATGAKVHNLRAFVYTGLTGNNLVAVGNKSDGTGSQLFYKTAPTTSEWTALSGTGTDNLYDRTWLGWNNGNYYYVTTAAGTNYVSSHNGISTQADKAVNLGTYTLFGNLVAGKMFDNKVYATRAAEAISEVQSGTVVVSSKTTAAIVNDIQSGNDQIGLFGNLIRPNKATLLLWDSASVLIDQKIEYGSGRGEVIGYPSGVWVGVLSEGLTLQSIPQTNNEVNGRFAMSVKAANGPTVETLYRVYADDNSDSNILPTRGSYHDTMLWYAKIPKNTGDYEGIWACGKGDINQPMGISILLDTASLGAVRNMYNFGSHYFFAHSNDGSVSRLDNLETGTFNVPATYETLVYGADTPFLKQFEGLSIVTENLPASATVAVSYRTDEQSSWTTLGTSTGTGLRKHNFTRASGVPIGKFQEIQFRIVFTGKIVVKSLTVGIVETDDLPFNV
jgi:hypothetical protein